MVFPGFLVMLWNGTCRNMSDQGARSQQDSEADQGWLRCELRTSSDAPSQTKNSGPRNPSVSANNLLCQPSRWSDRRNNEAKREARQHDRHVGCHRCRGQSEQDCQAEMQFQGELPGVGESSQPQPSTGFFRTSAATSTTHRSAATHGDLGQQQCRERNPMEPSATPRARSADRDVVAGLLAHTMPMDIQDALDFVRSNDRTVISTRRRDGRPQMSPVNAGVLDGTVCISSRAPLAKVRNLRRDSAVSVLVFTKEFFGSWVQIDGRAEIVEQPAALDLLETVYRVIAGEHPDWTEYRQAMIRDERVVIRIHPERASGQLY